MPRFPLARSLLVVLVAITPLIGHADQPSRIPAGFGKPLAQAWAPATAPAGDAEFAARTARDADPALRVALESAAAASRLAGEPLHSFETLQRFYTARGLLPVWAGNGGGGPIDGLITAIASADAHGLRPGDYHLRALESAHERGDRLALELLATDAYLTLGAHLLGGKVDPESIEPDWTARGRARDLAAHLEAALADGRIPASLDALQPRAAEYRVLKSMLAVYRRALGKGGWTVISAGPALKRGDRGARVTALRKRLQATGLADPALSWSDEFDESLEAAVLVFQRRIGLEADGVVGAITLRELNRSAADRVAQIRANLERWRWLPDDLGKRHLRVNIPDFRLEAREDGRIARVHDVVVGQTERKTPVFSGRIESVVLNPWWETPDRLARLDKLPMFRRDADAVKRLGFQVLDREGRTVDPESIEWWSVTARDFPFRLRQQPGPKNALGQVKMLFPNKHAVYLHDTPSRDLFERNQRAFSSGCVRVDDALGLAQWLLEARAGVTRERIETVTASGKETRFEVPGGVPVYLLYLTAVVDPDGSLRLLNDVYERDAALIAELDR